GRRDRGDLDAARAARLRHRPGLLPQPSGPAGGLRGLARGVAPEGSPLESGELRGIRPSRRREQGDPMTSRLLTVAAVAAAAATLAACGSSSKSSSTASTGSAQTQAQVPVAN